MPAPYMNPYYFQNNPAFQQQMYNPMAPYQERLNQMQAQYNQQPMIQQNQPIGLNGEIVDSIDVVKAKNVDMSGTVTFYPKSDLSEIYTKQLQPNGTSRINVYVKKDPVEMGAMEQQQTVSMDTLNSLLAQLKTDISSEINGLKDMVGAAINSKAAEPSKTTSKGGKADAA